MDLSAYFERIGYAGTPRVDLATLTELHRRHLRAVPYENFDVQFGRTLSIDPKAAFDKIVGQGRGGWCYEMNGVLGAVLMELGFPVTRMAGAVLRGERGDRALGNHLVLRVELDRPYIADVGFGDGILEPFPLAEGDHPCAGFDFRLERLDDGWLRFHNHAQGGAPYFDFQDQPAEPDQLSATCRWLNTSPDSIFVQTALCFRHTPEGIDALLGRAFRSVTPTGKTQHLIESADEFVSLLKHRFGLDLPRAADLWPRIRAKHDELFPQPATGG